MSCYTESVHVSPNCPVLQKASSPFRFGRLYEKCHRREEFAQFGQRSRDVVLHGLGADVERLGNIVVGHVLVTAHAENPAPLLGHVADGHVDHLQQIVRRHPIFGFGNKRILPGPDLRLVLVPDLPVFEGIENGVTRHAEQIAPERKYLPHIPALLPDLEENIMRNILGISTVLEKPESEVADLGGIAQVEDIQCFRVPRPSIFSG